MPPVGRGPAGGLGFDNVVSDVEAIGGSDIRRHGGVIRAFALLRQGSLGTGGNVNRWLLVGAVNGFLSVAAGAFAAHGLEGRIDARSLEIFNTAAQYHLIHALAVVAASYLVPTSARAAVAAWFFSAGIVLFSGSLYF